MLAHLRELDACQTASMVEAGNLRKESIMSNNQPVARFNLGSVTAAIWERQTNDGSRFYKASIETRFKDKYNTWQSSSIYSQSELVLLARVADLAETKLRQLEADLIPA